MNVGYWRGSDIHIKDIENPVNEIMAEHFSNLGIC
jgi:hypothetical protein